MDLKNEFDVRADMETTWRTLTDIERIAPCMPGATLTDVDGDTYQGNVRIKVGPITATFKGKANFESLDADAHRAVLKASGRDISGKGNASATITAELAPAGEGTHVSIATDLSISGKVAQFGRSALADISSKLIDQFSSCLEVRVLGAGPDEVAAAGAEQADSASKPSQESPGATAAPAGTRIVHPTEAEAIDLLDVAGARAVKRAVLALIAVFVAIWLVLRRRRR